MRRQSRRFWFGALCLALVVAAAGGVLAAESGKTRPRQIIIGLDLSKSNPLVDNAEYARKVAERIAPDIVGLAPRSVVMVRTFGAYDPTIQDFRFDKTISSKSRPEDVSYAVKGIVSGVPKLVAEGRLKVQMKTNIVPFLENMAQVVNCKKMPARIILVSDGIEDSDYANLTTLDAKLPLPKAKLFDKCDGLEILGLGLGAKNPALTNHLRDEWGAWAKSAGFKKFIGLNDW